MIGNGQTGASRIGAIASERIENNLIFTNECVFSISKRFLIGASGTVDIVIDPTAVSSDFLVFLPVSLKAFLAGPITVDFYFGVDAGNDGTLWDTINRNNPSLKTSELVARLNPTINDIGTKLPAEFEIFSDGTPATTVLGGEVTEDLVFNARKDGKYMFRLINTEASQARALAVFNWFEL
jgi:hypothetical protein